MRPLPHGQIETNDHSGATVSARRSLRSAHWQHNYVSGAVFLPPLRESAVTLTRANSRECCASARLSGSYLFNAHLHVSRQAVCNALHHLNSLSSAASPDGSKTIGKLLDNGKILFAKKQKLHD